VVKRRDEPQQTTYAAVRLMESMWLTTTT